MINYTGYNQKWNVGKDVYLQMTWSWPDKTWNILCSYCLQWNTSQSKFRNHFFFLRFPYCPNFFWFGVVVFSLFQNVIFKTFLFKMYNWSYFWGKIYKVVRQKYICSGLILWLDLTLIRTQLDLLEVSHWLDLTWLDLTCLISLYCDLRLAWDLMVGNWDLLETWKCVTCPQLWPKLTCWNQKADGEGNHR